MTNTTIGAPSAHVLIGESDLAALLDGYQPPVGVPGLHVVDTVGTALDPLPTRDDGRPGQPPTTPPHVVHLISGDPHAIPTWR